MTTAPLTEQQLDEYAQLIARTTPFGAAVASPGMGAALLAEVRRLQTELAKEELLHGDTIDDRDRAQDAADKLAYAVAPEDVIGEHTADNSPWANALDLVTPKVDVDKLRAELAATEMLAPQQCPAGLHADWLVDSECAHTCPWCQIDKLRTDAAAELMPVWEAVYEPGNVSDYLIGYMNDQDAATGAAEAWMRSQSEVTGRLEWVPWGDVTPMPDGYDRWFELGQQYDDGIDTDSGIVVRRRKEPVPTPTPAPLGASHGPAGDRDGETGAEGAAGRVGDSGYPLPEVTR